MTIFYASNQRLKTEYTFIHTTVIISGLVVLVLYSFVMLIQLLAMLVHRTLTLMHFLAKAPYKRKHQQTGWAFVNRYE